MNILITGGTGFIGSYLAKKFVHDGHKVVLFEANPNISSIKEIIDNVLLINGDLANWAEVLDVVSSYNIEEIYHTGAYVSDGAEKFPSRAYKVNDAGTWHVLEAARLFKVNKVIFTSTMATYGDHITEPIHNDSPQFPRIMYGITKVAGERLGEYYHYKYGLDFRGIRFPSVIGPGRKGRGVSAYTTLIVQNAALGIPYNIYVKPETTLPLLYIEDAVNSLLLLANAPRINLSRCMYTIKGIPCSAQEIVDEVKLILPQAALNFTPDSNITDLVDRIPSLIDDTLARNDWNWKESFDLSSMIKGFITEVQSYPNNYLDD